MIISARHIRSGCCCALLAIVCLAAPLRARAQEVSSAVYVRTDSDKTTVVAPRLHVQAKVAEPTRVSVTYAADVWTSASVDIRASASKVPVTEQRDEIDAAVDQELEDVNLTLAYRYSTEPDYVSHGVSGGFSYDFADNNSTLALGLSASADSVGKAGDPMFSRSVGTFGARLSFTQILGTNTLAQGMYELSRVSGYQVSPYRYVAIGGGGCTTADNTGAPLAALCVPEAGPDERLRHALGVELRHAFGPAWTASAAYRFYVDDWGLHSNTVRAELAYAIQPATILALRYRFYVQGAVDYYRATYTALQAFVTSDKELSPLSSHRVAVEFDRIFRFQNDRSLTMTLSVAPHYYAYSDFVPLKSITAFEFNAALVIVP